MNDPAHFLIVGDTTDLPFLRTLLGRLPVGAYGQVFVETAVPALALDLGAPEGLTVTVLPEARAARGEAAASAVLAWISEWLPDDPAAHAAPYVMWIGCATSTLMDRLSADLGDRLDLLHLHHTHHD